MSGAEGLLALELLTFLNWNNMPRHPELRSQNRCMLGGRRFCFLDLGAKGDCRGVGGCLDCGSSEPPRSCCSWRAYEKLDQ